MAAKIWRDGAATPALDRSGVTSEGLDRGVLGGDLLRRGAALRLRGVLRERAAVLSGGTGEGRTYALTATALVAIGVLAGFRLPLTPGTSGALLVPVILTMIPFLVASQAWVWWTFRHRVTGPSYL